MSEYDVEREFDLLHAIFGDKARRTADEICEPAIQNRQFDLDGVRDIYSTLDQYTIELITLRFGLDGSSPMSIVQVANHVGMSAERVLGVINQVLKSAFQRHMSPEEQRADNFMWSLTQAERKILHAHLGYKDPGGRDMTDAYLAKWFNVSEDQIGPARNSILRRLAAAGLTVDQLR